jgi:putative membrane protein
MARWAWSVSVVLALAPGCRDRPVPAPKPVAVAVDRVGEVLESLHQHDRHEIALGQMAQAQAASQAVKNFAATLVGDHQDADAKIVDFAAARRTTLVPDTPEQQASEREGTATAEKLHQLPGAEFDRAFASMVITDHQKAINLVKDVQQTVDDVRFKELLAQIDPLLHKHLESARQLEAIIASENAQRPPTPKVQARRRHGQK